ncbi:MAG: nucleotidyltransferase family protein [Lawsonibacter sp.]
MDPGPAGPDGRGVDLVLELPTVWAVSSAESFARGAVACWRPPGWWMCCPSAASAGMWTRSSGWPPGAWTARLYQPLVRRSGRGDALRRRPADGGAEPLGRGRSFRPAPSPNNNGGGVSPGPEQALGSAIRPMTVRGRGRHNACSGGRSAPLFSPLPRSGGLLEGELGTAEALSPPGRLELLEGAGVVRPP